MAQTIQVKRGLSSSLPTVLAVGELAFTTDTLELYVGTGTGRVKINPALSLPDIVAAGEYVSVTVDEKGRVVSGKTEIASSQVEGLGSAARKDAGSDPGNVPILDSNGKIDASLLPALAISDTHVVNSQAEMLALVAQVGDVAIREDESKSYILRLSDPSKIESWQELRTPKDAVQSVNGKSGTVVLGKADVGLGNVDNTSDEDKPISTAMAAALAEKAPIASPTFTGTPKGPTASAGTNTTQLATTAFVLGQASSSVAKALGSSASAGNSHRYAREDHVHPMPTSIDGGTF